MNWKYSVSQQTRGLCTAQSVSALHVPRVLYTADPEEGKTSQAFQEDMQIPYS